MWGGAFKLAYCLVSFPVMVIKHSDISNSKEKNVYSVYNSRLLKRNQGNRNLE